MRSYSGILAMILCLPFFSKGQAMGWDVGLFETPQQTLVELSKDLGSEYEDTHPIVSLDGHCLFFAKNGHPLNYGISDQEDIWVTYSGNGDNWTKPVNLGTPINSAVKNIPAGISVDGRQLYVLIRDEATRTTELSVFTKEERFWRFEQETKIKEIDLIGEIASATVSYDGKILCFTAPSKKRSQANDIYIAFRESPDMWSTPFKLPPLVNSQKDERYVFLAADQQTLYFSSNGLKGMGGYDLYVTRRLDQTWENWSSPVNLGELINTPENEISISTAGSGELAYYGILNEENSAALNYIHLPESIRPRPIQLIKGHLQLPGIKESIIVNKVNALTGQPWWNEKGQFQFIYDATTVPAIFKSLDNLYPQRVKEKTPKSELDKDQYNLLSSVGEEGVSYFQREAEIDLLQQRITENSHIKNEVLHELRLARGGFKEKVNQIDVFSLVSINEYLAGLLSDTIPELEYEQEEKARRKKKFKQFYEERPEPTNNEDYIWGEELSASDFGNVVDSTIRKELAPEALLSLKLKLYGEVKAELEKELPLDVLKKLENREQDLREQIKQSLAVAKTDHQPKGVGGSQHYPDSLSENKLAISEELRKDILEELEYKLDEESKAILKAELSYHSYAAVEEDWQKKLDAKVAQQILEEKEMGIGEKGMVPLSYDYDRDYQEIMEFKQIQQQYKLVPGVPGMAIQLSGVGFAPNTAELKSRSFQELDLLVEYLNRNSKLKVEIASHTNSWISHSQSMELTQKRAQVVLQYLTDKGILPNRLVAKGYGKKRPLTSNETVEGRQLNQRLEMIILENE